MIILLNKIKIVRFYLYLKKNCIFFLTKKSEGCTYYGERERVRVSRFSCKN